MSNPRRPRYQARAAVPEPRPSVGAADYWSPPHKTARWRLAVYPVIAILGLALLVAFKVPARGSAVLQPAAQVRPGVRGSSSAQPTAKGSGTYLGAVVSDPYGQVQVQITLAAGRIKDVAAVQLPSGGRSGFISQTVAPILKREAIAAQSANIDSVRGHVHERGLRSVAPVRPGRRSRLSRPAIASTDVLAVLGASGLAALAAGWTAERRAPSVAGPARSSGRCSSPIGRTGGPHPVVSFSRSGCPEPRLSAQALRALGVTPDERSGAQDKRNDGVGEHHQPRLPGRQQRAEDRSFVAGRGQLTREGARHERRDHFAPRCGNVSRDQRDDVPDQCEDDDGRDALIG